MATRGVIGVRAQAQQLKADRDAAVLIANTAESKWKTDSASFDSLVQQLKAASVQVVSVGTPYIHAKAIVADGARASVGSENFSTGSLQYNREPGLITTNAASALGHRLPHVDHSTVESLIAWDTSDVSSLVSGGAHKWRSLATMIP